MLIHTFCAIVGSQNFPQLSTDGGCNQKGARVQNDGLGLLVYQRQQLFYQQEGKEGTSVFGHIEADVPLRGKHV